MSTPIETPIPLWIVAAYFGLVLLFGVILGMALLTHLQRNRRRRITSLGRQTFIHRI